MDGLRIGLGIGVGSGNRLPPYVDMQFLYEGFNVAETPYTFSQLISFTRTSSATYVNSAGNIVSTPASKNLLTFTEEFDNAAWTKTNATITANSVAAPDGLMTADTLAAAAGAGIAPLAASTATTVTSTVYTASVFVRPGTHTFVQLYLINQAADWCNFTLTGNGSVQNNGAAVGAISFDSATGYYRISMTYTAGGTDRRPGIALVPSGTATRVQTGTYAGTETIHLWGAQLETGSTATSYTRNFGGLFPPRFDYDPVTLQPRGLLIEEQRTNLFTNSEFPNGLSDAPVRIGNVSTSTFSLLSGNTGLAINNTGAVTSFAYKSDFATVNGTTYTISAFVRMDDGDAPSFGSAVNTASQNSFSLVVALHAIDPTTYTVTAMGNGFYRVSAVSTAGAASVDNGVVKYDTNDGRAFTVSGYQIEAGAFATSYIPTVASQVTRTADVATITGANFSQWYNQSEGTLLVEAQTSADITSSYSMAALNTAVTSIVGFDIDSSGAYRLRITNAGANQALINAVNPTVANTIYKMAGAYKANDFAVSVNGSAVATDTAGTVPNDMVGLAIGSGTFAGAVSWNGHIRRISYYPSRLSNAQLQALSA